MPYVSRRLFPATLALAAGLGLGSAAQAQGFDIETGLEAIDNPATLIEGLHRLYIGRRITPNVSVGGSVYSAALGDAGGAFFWGFEGVARVPLSERFGLSFAGFIGGGGGASQVVGDGLMLRAAASLDYRLTAAWELQASASWIRIDGAPIDGPAYGLGLRYRIGGGGTPGAGMPEFDAIGAVVTQMVSPSGTLNRSAGAQDDVSIAGARVFFDLGPSTQFTFGSAGAARGAQGYMEITGGVRQRVSVGRLSFFAEGSAGFAGGGLVDTGAGLILRGSLGVAVPVTRTLDVELAAVATGAVNGEYRSAGLSLGLTHHLNRQGPGGAGQRWAYTGGIEIQRTGAGYFVAPGNTAAYTAMQYSSFDYFVGQRLYVTGTAATAVGGGVAGFAVGMFGLGYEIPIGERWHLSIEGQLGAAGGGGVNTAGGLVAGLRAEVDYRVGQNWRLSAGLGQLRAVNSGGFSPLTLTLGVKIPFVTHR